MERIKSNWSIIVICVTVVVTTLVAAYETNLGDLSLGGEPFGIPFFLAPFVYLAFIWLWGRKESLNKPEVAIGVVVVHILSIVLLLMGGLVGGYWHVPLLIAWVIFLLAF